MGYGNKKLKIITLTELSLIILSLIILMWIMQLREVACKIDWSEIIKGSNVEDHWVAFKKVFIDIRDK